MQGYLPSSALLHREGQPKFEDGVDQVFASSPRQWPQANARDDGFDVSLSVTGERRRSALVPASIGSAMTLPTMVLKARA